MRTAKFNIADYSSITGSDGLLLTPLETRKLHQQSVKWLEQELAQPFAGKTVVVTHFAPHPLCVAPEHQESSLSPYFVNDLRPLMERFPIAFWCFGHTHTNCDFTTVSGCRVISNQRGYPGERDGNGFQPELVIDLDRVRDHKAEYLQRYHAVVERIDAQVDVRGSDLSFLVNSCMDNNGILSDDKRQKYSQHLPKKTLDFIESTVRMAL
jgi:hypothetical protein